MPRRGKTAGTDSDEMSLMLRAKFPDANRFGGGSWSGDPVEGTVVLEVSLCPDGEGLRFMVRGCSLVKKGEKKGKWGWGSTKRVRSGLAKSAIRGAPAFAPSRTLEPLPAPSPLITRSPVLGPSVYSLLATRHSLAPAISHWH